MTKLDELPISIGSPMRDPEKIDKPGRIKMHRVLALTSPLWLAALMIVVGAASPAFRQVLEFITSSPLR